MDLPVNSLRASVADETDTKATTRYDKKILIPNHEYCGDILKAVNHRENEGDCP